MNTARGASRAASYWNPCMPDLIVPLPSALPATTRPAAAYAHASPATAADASC